MTDPTRPATTGDVTAQIAVQIGETEPGPRYRIRRIIRTIGADAAWSFVRRAEAVAANGGMLLEKEQRRRTFGDVFFLLVRQGGTNEQRAAIWPQEQKRQV